jgi:hypothetical protein
MGGSEVCSTEPGGSSDQSVAEVCDGFDNDCDGVVDNGCTHCEGEGECGAGVLEVVDGVEICSSEPGGRLDQSGVEICDGLDNDCDGETDEDFLLTTYYRDSDGDGYGDSGDFTQACSPPGGYVADSTDCNDAAGSIHPGATEIVGDGVDQDCNGVEVCYADADDDGYRPDATTTVSSADSDCTDTQEAERTDPAGDCNDANASIHPGAVESCNQIDDDCDGIADLGCPPQVVTEAAESIGTTSVTLKGAVNPNGSNTLCYFEYGPGQLYGRRTSDQTVGSGTDEVPISELINGLSPDTEYHFRLVGTNSEGTSAGQNQTFRMQAIIGDLICVEPAGVCGSDGRPCFAEIQAAIDSAEPGVTIQVGEGSYFENVVIDQGVTLEFTWEADFSSMEQAGPVILEGPGS